MKQLSPPTQTLLDLMETPHYSNIDINQALIKIKKLIKEGADVNVKDQRGNTLLVHASHKGDLRIFKFLIEKCDIDLDAKNANGFSIFFYSALFGQEAFKYLDKMNHFNLYERDANHHNMLTHAVYNKNKEMTYELAFRGVPCEVKEETLAGLTQYRNKADVQEFMSLIEKAKLDSLAEAKLSPANAKRKPVL